MERTEAIPYEPAPEAIARAAWLRLQLLSWFRSSGRSFPWRDPRREPYEIAIAEILLQKTTAATVARAYSGFIKRYPSWASLALARLEDLESELKPLGLWRQRAQVLRQLAQSIEERGGTIPSSRAELERLRGIGPYTASAVLAIVYGRTEALLDVNMARLLVRFFGPIGLSGKERSRSLHRLASLLIEGEHCLQVNWSVLDFGALVCKARRPRCQECQLKVECWYARTQITPTSDAPSG
ncbi:hypothetical protein KSD_10370 [Ktedonobacter sp. SOSP1-85]|uniref:hypothetical protein n=1 Tax=Ktedonobacter sp. SOSP1-85 TaxID=2778367 RepID=UPI00191501A5|nr:hypothetical protein KSD_10370 [Ktedonobacter sp. SOSP1-85]